MQRYTRCGFQNIKFFVLLVRHPLFLLHFLLLSCLLPGLTCRGTPDLSHGPHLTFTSTFFLGFLCNFMALSTFCTDGSQIESPSQNRDPLSSTAWMSNGHVQLNPPQTEVCFLPRKPRPFPSQEIKSSL